MIYRISADFVLLLHLTFVLFVGLGALLALKRPRALWLHVPAVLWGVVIEFTGGVCPLTPLENGLRRLAGDQGYVGGFLEHYLLSMLYPEGLTREIQTSLGVAVAVMNLVLWVAILRRQRRKPPGPVG